MDCDGQSKRRFEQFKRYFTFRFVYTRNFGAHTFEGSTSNFYHIIFVQVLNDWFSDDVSFDFCKLTNPGILERTCLTPAIASSTI